MVRLKATKVAAAVQVFRYFNSTMVRLKAYMDGAGLTVKTDFNSTMVRLKADKRIYLYNQLRAFQFHYGTIKRHYRRP